MGEIHYINLEVLNASINVLAIFNDLEKDYYWSNDFSSELYISLAKYGFISTTTIHDGNEILLPQIQLAYAVLDFDNLHISKKVSKLLKNKNLEIIIDDNVAEIAKHIESSYDESWLTDKYVKILEETAGFDINFEVVTVYIKEKNTIIAGEIGYVIGETYTSLSGFCSSEKACQNYGTAQLVLLAQCLRAKGFKFWNLGHPNMDYKIKLGAKVTPRIEFLKRWLKDSSQKKLDLKS